MSDIAESAGLPATADFMLAVIETEELADADFLFRISRFWLNTTIIYEVPDCCYCLRTMLT